jgi:hypothetical protein
MEGKSNEQTTDAKTARVASRASSFSGRKSHQAGSFDRLPFVSAESKHEGDIRLVGLLFTPETFDNDGLLVAIASLHRSTRQQFDDRIRPVDQSECFVPR